MRSSEYRERLDRWHDAIVNDLIYDYAQCEAIAERARLCEENANKIILKQRGDIVSLRAEVARLREVLAEVGIPVEVIAAQIETKPYAEITLDLQAMVVKARDAIRAALAETKEGE